MKTIIAGSRDFNHLSSVAYCIKQSGFNITEVVSGGCKGVDLLGEEWAKKNKIPIKRFPAAWDEHGKAAGPIRNQQMAEYADALIAIVAPNSKGTRDMLNKANKHDLKIWAKFL
jgi:predicted double-glycine peptidase